MCDLMTLLHVCGELMLLRQTYQPPAGRDVTQADHPQLTDSVNLTGSRGLCDLSTLYRGWSARRWNQLRQLITDSRHRRLQLCWVSTRSPCWAVTLVNRIHTDSSTGLLIAKTSEDTHLIVVPPCILRGCKNRPAPFPGRMS